MVFRSPFPDVPLPAEPLHAFALRRAAELGEKPALVDGPSGRTITYAALAAGIERVGANLAQRGLRPGQVVALFLPNVPEFALAFFGTLRAGGVVTTLSPLATEHDIAVQLQDAAATRLVTIRAFLDRALPAARAAGVAEVFVLDHADEGLPFAALLAPGASLPPLAIDPAATLAVLPYSSGTTGLPKGVMLTHRNLAANVVQTLATQHIDDRDRIVAVLPFFHIYGMVVVLTLGLHVGATVVTMPRFELEPFLALMERHRITRAFLAPPAIVLLAKHPAVARHDLSALCVVFSGAAPLDAALELECRARIGCDVIQGYGMTEASPVTHATPDAPGAARPGSVGVLVPNTEARIVDVATGEVLGPGADGEVHVRGPQVMQGYLNNPDATAATLDADGWLHTGDIGRVDAEGYFAIVDRLKELIKYKGYQVPPAELEAVLLSHPCVADAAVIGVPHDDAGEVPKAFVVLKGEVATDALLHYVAERVASYKRVRAVEVIDAIPKSPAGKILRRVLKERPHRP
ncbi:MAG TPA: AMP-binding protein [Gemmatimonadales bacterium]|nr:AMP-binding protein [Gemmatimonadales bacterium]